MFERMEERERGKNLNFRCVYSGLLVTMHQESTLRPGKVLTGMSLLPHPMLWVGGRQRTRGRTFSSATQIRTAGVEGCETL